MVHAAEIGYWFFRLNGFFVIDKYDEFTDLLAVRFPNVYDKTVLKEKSDIHRAFNEVDLDIDKNIVGIICQILIKDKEKTSAKNKEGVTEEGVTEETELSSLKSSIKRLGFFQDENITNTASKEVKKKGIYKYENYTLVRIIISDKPNVLLDDIYINLNLYNIKEHIKGKLKKCLDNNDTMVLKSTSLIHYILWEGSKGNKEKTFH